MGEQFDVASDRLVRVGDGRVGQGLIVGAGESSETGPEVGVGEEAAAAAGVVEDGHLERLRVVTEHHLGDGSR